MPTNEDDHEYYKELGILREAIRARLEALIPHDGGTAVVGTLLIRDAIQLLDEVERLGRKSDREMERVKACEHIAEGDEGWEVLADLCPSTAAVARLREALESYPWKWVRATSPLDDDMLREWLAKRSKALAPAEKEKT